MVCEPLLVNLRTELNAGASYGQWRVPWSPEQREDSVEIIDWITSQSWSNGKVFSRVLVSASLHCQSP